jgi:hypothetical protein
MAKSKITPEKIDMRRRIIILNLYKKIKGCHIKDGILRVGDYELLPYEINKSYIEVVVVHTKKFENDQPITVASVRDMGNVTRIVRGVKAVVF